jgi:hypothetical protein
VSVEIFDRLQAANGGTLSGFRRVRLARAWPGRVTRRSGPDQIKPTQLRFVEVALRFHPLEEFMIVEVTGPGPPSTPVRRPRQRRRRRVVGLTR